MEVKNFDCWHETHFEVTAAILRQLENQDEVGAAWDRYNDQGNGGLYELAKELTDKFQELHENTVWGEEVEFMEEVTNFLEKELWTNQ